MNALEKNAILTPKPKPIFHEQCGKKHGTEALVEKCEARFSARLVDRTRRIENARAVSVEEYIRRRKWEAATYDKITAELKRDYPPPPAGLIRAHEGWWTGNVIELDSRHPRFASWTLRELR